MSDLLISPIQTQHLAAIQIIQQAAYPRHFWESDAVFIAKQQYSPDSCVLVQTTDQQTVAYVFAHPWPAAQIPTLHQTLDLMSGTERVLYIHDLAVHPQWHGQGVASVLMQYLENYAQQHSFKKIALVAVQGAQAFWQRLGFVTQSNISPQLAIKLAAYGANAVYMMKETNQTHSL